MNRNTALIATVIAATLGGFGTAAYADEADGSQYAMQAASTKTRAQVQSELAQFRQGANPWAQDYNPLAAFHSTASKADVRAEFLQSRGQTQAMNREDSGSAYLSAQGPQGETTGTLFAGQASADAS